MTNSHRQKLVQSTLAIAQTHKELLQLLRETFPYLPPTLLEKALTMLKTHEGRMESIEQLLMEGMNDGN